MFFKDNVHTLFKIGVEDDISIDGGEVVWENVLSIKKISKGLFIISKL
jgi:hypothetical protein